MRDQIADICERSAVGYAPIIRPDELFADPQLQQPGAMVEVTLADGRVMPIPALPLEMNGERFGVRLDIPQAGEHSADVARELGCDADEIRALVEEGVLGVPDEGVSNPRRATSSTR
jgi:crotonobetainyl-CoA:carnitine CoA-transferase CaiB-like acyl-CoA transferase